jgi:hypothetical protein
MGACQKPAIAQLVQILPNGLGGHLKPQGEFVNGHAPGLPGQNQNLLLTGADALHFHSRRVRAIAGAWFRFEFDDIPFSSVFAILHCKKGSEFSRLTFVWFPMIVPIGCQSFGANP